MNSKSEITISNKSSALSLISWLFGIAVLAVGLINTFWGNDLGFGVFLILCSFVYFPPLEAIFKRVTGFPIPGIAKILLAVFIIWASLGVGELFGKIDLMVKDL